MNPKKKDDDEASDTIAFEPFSEPRTIPTGWDVSALNSTNREEEALPIRLPVEELNDVTQDAV